MRVLITGAAGILGKQIVRYLRERSHDVVAMDCHEGKNIVCVDLRQQEATYELIDQYTPDTIIHLAALKNIAYCEKNPDLSRASNFGITKNLVEYCNRKSVPLVFFSTDYVFGQQDKFWNESDTLCPVTRYGKDKADSERLIQLKLDKYAIIRTAQIYGVEDDFVELVVRSLSKGEEFQAMDNLVNCPTWIGDLLAMLGQIIEQSHYGVFHCVGPEPLSRFEYAQQVAKAFGLEHTLIKSWHLDFSKDPRPPVVRLDGSRTYTQLNVFPKILSENLIGLTSNYKVQ